MDTEIDVIVFETGDRRFAMELRYVQEVFTLGYVTTVPLAPRAIQGATSVRGQMVPVIALRPFFGATHASPELPGTPTILVRDGDRVAALPVRRIIDVVSVPAHRFEAGGEGSGPLVPGCFRGPAGSIPLLDIRDVLGQIQRASREASQSIHHDAEAS
jgi:chemotaxis signal transduction protein